MCSASLSRTKRLTEETTFWSFTHSNSKLPGWVWKRISKIVLLHKTPRGWCSSIRIALLCCQHSLEDRQKMFGLKHFKRPSESSPDNIQPSNTERWNAVLSRYLEPNVLIFEMFLGLSAALLKTCVGLTSTKTDASRCCGWILVFSQEAHKLFMQIRFRVVFSAILQIEQTVGWYWIKYLMLIDAELNFKQIQNCLCADVNSASHIKDGIIQRVTYRHFVTVLAVPIWALKVPPQNFAPCCYAQGLCYLG